MFHQPHIKFQSLWIVSDFMKSIISFTTCSFRRRPNLTLTPSWHIVQRFKMPWRTAWTATCIYQAKTSTNGYSISVQEVHNSFHKRTRAKISNARVLFWYNHQPKGQAFNPCTGTSNQLQEDGYALLKWLRLSDGSTQSTLQLIISSFMFMKMLKGRYRIPARVFKSRLGMLAPALDRLKTILSIKAQNTALCGHGKFSLLRRGPPHVSCGNGLSHQGLRLAPSFRDNLQPDYSRLACKGALQLQAQWHSDSMDDTAKQWELCGVGLQGQHLGRHSV